jgi:uncharacterized protein YndB with AHSA1/START domain
MRTQMILAGFVLAAGTLSASAASVEKEIDIKAPADKVWAMIGPFCSIKDWHPAIGKCTESDGVRTLVTKDGKATFVEKQTKNDPSGMEYSYEIEKSPLPITDYKSTLKVTKTGDNTSKVTWSSTYAPDQGKEAAADQAIAGIYQGGLDNIQKMAGTP